MKRFLAVFLTMTMLTGCSTTSDVPEETGSAEEVVDEAVEEADNDVDVATSEVSIVDVVGREVTLEQPAQRVVGVHNPTMSTAIILGGGGEHLAAFNSKEPIGDLYSYVFPELETLPKIGTGKDINIEACIEADADLAILPERNVKQVELFEEVGIPVAVVLSSDESFDTIKQTLTMLGTLLGEDERALEISNIIDSKLAKASELTADVTEKKKVLFLGNSSQLSVSNGTMLQSAIIEAAGGENVAKDLPGEGSYVDVSIEEIVNMNPEVIYLPNTAKYTIDDIKNDEVWQTVDAVINDNIYVFPSDLEPWDYPTPAACLGVMWSVSNLYPELYSVDEVIADANEYYGYVYGQEFTAEQIGLE